MENRGGVIYILLLYGCGLRQTPELLPQNQVAYYVKLAQEALPPDPWAHNPLPDGVPLYHSLLPAEEKEKLESYFYPQWQQAELYYNQAGNAVLLVPLHRPLSVFYFTAFRRRLRVEFDQNKQVVSSHIVEFITEDKVLREKGDLVLAEPQLFDRQLPGILVTYDFHYRLTYQLQGDSIAKESIYLHNPKQLLAIKQHPEQGFITLDYPSDQAPPSVTITCNDGSMWTNTSDGHWVSNHGEIVSMADVGGNPCQSGGGGASGGGAGGGSGIGSPPVGGGGSGSGSGSGNPGWQDGIELPPMDPGDTHPKFPPIKNPDNPLPGNPIGFGPFTPTEAFLSKPGLKVLWQ